MTLISQSKLSKKYAYVRSGLIVLFAVLRSIKREFYALGQLNRESLKHGPLKLGKYQVFINDNFGRLSLNFLYLKMYQGNSGSESFIGGK